jgi:DNA-binding CsgD family transcriptional regulator
MRTSENLHSAEVHEALGLVSGLSGLDPSANTIAGVVAERLSAVLRARVCLIGEVPSDLSGVKMPWKPRAEYGWRDEHQRHMIFSSLDDPNAKDLSLIELLHRDGEFRTFSRRELVDDEAWYSSRYYTLFRSNAGLDDQAYSIYASLSRRGWMGIIGLHRAASDPPFEATTVTMLELLHRQLVPILWQTEFAGVPSGTVLQPVNSLIPGNPARNNGSGRGLTPAQLRVLPYLLQGHREERIAELLCRSRHTVHDHVMAIYREYGVHNRVELILRLGGDAAQIPNSVE